MLQASALAYSCLRPLWLLLQWLQLPLLTELRLCYLSVMLLLLLRLQLQQLLLQEASPQPVEQQRGL